MRDLFHTICSLVTDANPMTENIDQPIKDYVQESWLDYLERRQGTLEEIPNLQTFEELVAAFEPDAALIATIYRMRQIDHHRVSKGSKNSPHKAALLQQAFSLDGFDDTGEPWKDIIEDNQGEIPFRHVEELDLLINDERIKSLPPSHQDAIKRFTVAWFLIESGYKLPNSVSVRIGRDRKLTGLPLVLPKGPKTKRRNHSQVTKNS